jgi:hypothetical protein
MLTAFVKMLLASRCSRIQDFETAEASAKILKSD